MAHTDLVLPFIYTPTVGEACEKYHTLPGLKTRGLYLSLQDRGQVLAKLRGWAQQQVGGLVVELLFRGARPAVTWGGCCCLLSWGLWPRSIKWAGWQVRCCHDMVLGRRGPPVS